MSLFFRMSGLALAVALAAVAFATPTAEAGSWSTLGSLPGNTSVCEVATTATSVGTAYNVGSQVVNTLTVDEMEATMGSSTTARIQGGCGVVMDGGTAAGQAALEAVKTNWSPGGDDIDWSPGGDDIDAWSPGGDDIDWYPGDDEIDWLPIIDFTVYFPDRDNINWLFAA